MSKFALDSNVIIYFFGKTGQFQDQAATLIRSAGSEKQLLVSELVFLELLSKQSFSDFEADSLYLESRDLPIKIISVSIHALLKAASLRRTNNIKTPDAIHLASAIVHGCEYFVTNDQKLLKLKIPGIKIINLEAANNLAN